MSTILYADRMESSIPVPVIWITPRACEWTGDNSANVSDQICVCQTIHYLFDINSTFTKIS